jgi:hypothetical protein
MEDMIPINVTVFRVIRTIRIIRAFKFLKELYNILMALYDSLKHFITVCMMSSLMLLVFCLLGETLFGHIKEGKNGGIDANNNFSSFYISAVTLWRMTTGDGWNTVMHDTIEEMGLVASLYWIFFVVINVHIFLNIVIAVIFDKLEEDAKMKRRDGSDAIYKEAID